ncbi:MAG: 3-phosphoshikimate 1-carboxyvinyltransferase [Vicinamibacterales bacterium]
MRVAHAIVVQQAASLRGTLRVPGDKSISHRYALLSAIADGASTVANYSSGADCASTLACLAALGVPVTRQPAPVPGDGDLVHIGGRGPRGLRQAPGPVDCGNSGTTMRLLAGLLAAHPFRTVLVGDASLSRRPMGRVIAPLVAMGAAATAAAGDRPPVTIDGGPLHGIDYTPPVPSAQLKSAVLLAGLHASGDTRVIEPAATRDHTERALRAFGARLAVDGLAITLPGGQRLAGGHRTVPGDLSSAAFFAAAAAALPGSDVEITGVGLNPTRAGILALLRRFGAEVTSTVADEADGEPVGALRVRGHGLGSLTITPAEVPDVIDELPVLAAMATAGGEIHVTGAGELRVKESDRITALVEGLRALGADAEELPDGFHVRGARPLRGGTADARGDHRLAMAFTVAALAAAGPSTITGADVVDVSDPSFFDDLGRLRA